MAQVAAPTGVVAFNVDSHTLHSLCHLLTKGELKDLEGECLYTTTATKPGRNQASIIILSIVGRKLLSQIDIHL